MPYSTTLLDNNFGTDYGRLRANERLKKKDEINDKIATELLKEAVQENAKKDFM